MYALLLTSDKLEAEHGLLSAHVERLSGGDFVEAFRKAEARPGAIARGEAIPFTVAYLFTTDLPPSKLQFAALNGDRYLLLQIEDGGAHWCEGFSVARSWLDRHREWPQS